MPTVQTLQPLSYHQQRMRFARRLLLRGLKRWAAFVAMALLMLTAGAQSAVQIAAGLVGASVAPLLLAAHQTLWLLPLAALYAGLACLPVLLTRALWWPRRWAEAERALPLQAAELRASDRRVLRWLLLPLQALFWSGMAVLAWERAGTEPGPVMRAAFALLGAGLAAAAISDRWMHRLRERECVLHSTVHAVMKAQKAQPSGALLRRPAALFGLRRIGWPLVMLWWPLWRGLAARTARGLLLAGVATPALAAAPMAAPAYTGWWLAATALAGLVFTARLRGLVESELQSRWPRLRHLPVAVTHWQAACRWLVLAPLLLALLSGGLGAALLLLGLGARPLLLLAYWTVLLGSAWLESRPPPLDAGHHAARALLCLALAVALGSEVLH